MLSNASWSYDVKKHSTDYPPYCSGPPLLYLLNLLYFQIICVYFTVYAHGYSIEPSPCRNHLCTGYATPSPLLRALWDFEAGVWGDQAQCWRLRLMILVLDEWILGAQEKCRGVSVTLHGCQKWRCSVKAVWQTADLCTCGYYKQCSYMRQNKCFLMHVAKCLVLIVFNVKNQRKMLRDCFIQPQLVSRSVYPGKETTHLSSVLGIYCPVFCLTPFPGKLVLLFSIVAGELLLFFFFSLKLPLFWP